MRYLSENKREDMRMKKRTAARSMAALMGAAMVLTACGGGNTTAPTTGASSGGETQTASESAESGKITKTDIVVGQASDIVTLDPAGQQDTTSGVLMKHAYSTLLDVDNEGQVVPDLAESYEMKSDTEYVFKLREDACFWDGTPVTTETGEIFWGEPGTNGQHAFYQLIHQGTQLIPADFIAFANTPNPLKDGDQDMHELLLGNYFAQTKALAFGKTADEVRAEGTPEDIVPARVFSGNRPTTSIFGVRLDAFTLGELISLYEMVTFVEGTVWGIDSYDQWGVELGKQLAKQITPAISQNDEALAAQDASTRSLINFYRKVREF